MERSELAEQRTWNEGYRTPTENLHSRFRLIVVYEGLDDRSVVQSNSRRSIFKARTKMTRAEFEYSLESMEASEQQ